MELTPKQQVVELIKEAQNIVLFTHDRPDSDALGSLLALTLCLQKLGKNVQAVATGARPVGHDFLPGTNLIQSTIASGNDFVISIDTTTAQIEKILYKREGLEKLNIVVTPKEGSLITPDLVKMQDAVPSQQLIIVLDCSDISRIGPLYEQNTELFYNVPVINIDHHPGNDYYGKVNLVDLTATSTAEILVSLLESLGRDKPLLDEDIATCLLTGIMGDTGSFQNTNTTPKSFTVAAQLVAAGAKQQDIVRHIYKTKTLSTLRLWGKALATLQEDKDLKFVWSSLNAQEIADAKAAPEQTSGLIDELLKTADGVDFALLLSERDGKVHGSLRSVDRTMDVSQVAALFGGGGHTMAAAFDMADVTLSEVEENIIHKIRQFQAKRLQQG